MKKIINLFACLITISTVLFISCSSNVKGKEKPYATFSIHGLNARTALPAADAINWNSYLYTLKYTEDYELLNQKEEKTFLEYNKAENFQVIKLPVNLTNYKFTLIAYDSDTKTPVMAGAKAVNFSTAGAQSVTFMMYPVSGATGSAVITVNIPDDGEISTIKAGCTNSPIASYENTEQKQEITVTEGRTSYQVVFENLPSAVSQYAMIYLYDAAGGEIGAIPEGMLIVGGLTSISTVNITEADYHTYPVVLTLKKDEETWTGSTKTLKLKNGSLEYTLLQDKGNGEFRGNAAEGIYDIYVDGIDTGVDFVSSVQRKDLEYFSITKAPGAGIEITAPEYIIKGQDFTYSTALKNGFETPSEYKIFVNGTAYDAAIGSEITYQQIAEPVKIETSDAVAIPYTIEYVVSDSEGVWQADANKTETYYVTDTVELPTSADLRGVGKILDGWKIGIDGVTGYSYIQPGTLYGNLTLYPIWKESAYVDTASKIIYANGISLLIEANGSATNIYLDHNRNGKKDSGEEQLFASDSTSDFTGYELRAENKDGKPINSDFKFTMTGGLIASITGMGANAVNRSELKISGTAKIGSYTSIKEEDGTYSYTDVKGVDLSSIYLEKVIVENQMSGDYRIVLISQYEYDGHVPHYVGEIGNSRWATFKNFTCFKKKDNSINAYDNILLGMKEADGKTIIRMVNPNPIAMPTIDGEDHIIGDVNNGFTLGEDRIQAECSVFSVSVENGTFVVGNTTMDGATSYLAQPKTTTYKTELSKDESYVYMHIMSSNNQISPETASKFLAGITFKRNPATPNVPVKVKVNLETVPYSEIVEAKIGTKNNAAFSYFNGSFYMGIEAADGINWIDAYNGAKSKVFNGLQGYLINITSEVENNYIFNQMKLGRCWTGGARYDTAEDHQKGDFDCLLNESYHVEYDSDTRTAPAAKFRTDTPVYRWQSGPEAGQAFTTGKIGTVSGTAGTVISKNYLKNEQRFSVSGDTYRDVEVKVLDKSGKELGRGVGTIEVETGWFSTTYYYYNISNIKLSSGTPAQLVVASDFVMTQTGNGKYSNKSDLMYANWDTNEPNDSYNGQSEECVHYKDNGKWNDFNWNRNLAGGNDNILGYIVEFTPYGLRTASSPSRYSEAEY